MFWRQFTPASCLPDNCNCEFIQLDAWIAQPSAFWSSLIYIFMAFFLYRQVPNKNLTLKLWTGCFVFQGLVSHFAHGSFIEFAMAMDFSGIILIISFFLINKWLTRWVSTPWKVIFLLLCYQGGLWLTFYSLNKWFKIALCVTVFVASVVEILHSEGRSFLKARDLHWSLLILFASFSLFIMDELRILCDPHSWVQGHSFWHLGTSVSIFLYGRWRFRDLSAEMVATQKI